mmetsp:Transcript_28429/g.80306  ORF Transcript_28429/g.80306 Transcript_28429/m.80306 type:complete len:248 (+) Transcript_28429:59-802(+)
MGNLTFSCRRPKADPVEISRLRTGDVICIRDPQFAHAGACLSQNLLCWNTNHVGMVVDPADLPSESALRTGHPEIRVGRRYLLHTLFTGVKVWDLGQYLQRTRRGRCGARGTMWARQIVTEGRTSDDELRRSLALVVDKTFDEVRDKHYEDQIFSLLNAYFDSCEAFGNCGKNSGDDSSLFCSELVSMMLQQGGVLGTQRPADEIVPQDFLYSNGKTVEGASMADGFRLGPVLELEPDDESDDDTDR